MSTNSQSEAAAPHRSAPPAGRGVFLPPGSWRRAALAMIFVWFFLGGIGHFVWTEGFASVVPPYVPYPVTIVLVTGLCEIAGALGLLSPRLRSAAGVGLMLFAVCVVPVHVEMLRHAERYADIGTTLLWIRLLFQPALIWIIWKATRPVPASSV